MKKLFAAAIALSCSTFLYAQQGHVEKAIEDKYMKEHGNAGLSKLQDFMDNMNNAVTQPVYTFPLAVTMHVTIYDKGAKKNETDMKYHISTADEAVGMSGSNMKGGNKNMFMVYDNKNNSMLMLDEKRKSYTVMNINAFMSAEMQANRGKNTGVNTKCTKTGKTKNIKGYTCEEYVCTDADKPDSKVEVWVTNKIPVKLSSAAKGQPWAGYYAALNGVVGMMMEGKVYKKDQLESTMDVTDVDEKSNLTVTLSNYTKNEMFGR